MVNIINITIHVFPCQQTTKHVLIDALYFPAIYTPYISTPPPKKKKCFFFLFSKHLTIHYIPVHTTISFRDMMYICIFVLSICCENNISSSFISNQGADLKGVGSGGGGLTDRMACSFASMQKCIF